LDSVNLPRVHIVGGPGSGKTTVARELATRSGAPIFDLDQVAYLNGAGPKRSLAERLADIAAIRIRPEWITEGIYLWWVDDLLREADAIVWLDVPWRIAAWRIISRHARASLAGTNRHPGLQRLVRFLRSSHRYYVDAALRPPNSPDEDGVVTRAQTAKELAAFGDKLVRCADSAAVALFLHKAELRR
jgi:shikimate kinase